MAESGGWEAGDLKLRASRKTAECGLPAEELERSSQLKEILLQTELHS